MLICWGYLLFSLLVFSIEVRGKAPQCERESDPFLAAESLMKKNDTENFDHGDERGDDYRGQKGVDTEDHTNCAQEKELPEDGAPRQHDVIPRLS